MSGTKKDKASRASAAVVEFDGSNSLRKELQRTVAFRCYEYLHASGQTKDQRRLMDEIYELYHGDPSDDESLSYCHKCMMGLEMFGPMFDADHTGTNTQRRVLKPPLIANYKVKGKIVADPDTALNGINLTTLSARALNDPALVLGRNVWDWSMEVLANCRKLRSYVQVSKYKDGHLDSGESWEDYLKWCRYKMKNHYEKDFNNKKRTSDAIEIDGGEDSLHGSQQPSITQQSSSSVRKSTQGDEEGDEEEDEDEEEVEEVDDEEVAKKAAQTAELEAVKAWDGNFTFNGFIAWALWGHIVPEDMDDDYKAISFWTDDEVRPDNKKKMGRVSSRAQAAEESNRGRVTAPSSEGRGMSNRDALLERQLEFSERLASTASQMAVSYDRSINFNGAAISLQFQQTQLRDALMNTNMEIKALSSIVASKPECFQRPEVWKHKFKPFADYLAAQDEKTRILERMQALTDQMVTAQTRSSISPLSVPGHINVATVNAAESAAAAAASGELPAVDELQHLDGEEDSADADAS